MAKIRIKKLPPEPPVSHYKLRWACSFFGLTAPVWIPILFYAIPMSKKLAESVSSFGMLGMLVLPFIPLTLWEGRRLRTYLTILIFDHSNVCNTIFNGCSLFVGLDSTYGAFWPVRWIGLL